MQKSQLNFCWEDTICRHSCFGKLALDGGPGNAGFVKAFSNKYGINRLVTSRINPEANGMVKWGHRPIVDALAQISEGEEICGGRTYTRCCGLIDLLSEHQLACHLISLCVGKN